MNYTAIDFETATSLPSSVCSLGICVVENNEIVESKEFLFRPEPFVFNEFNIKIHGITPDMVERYGNFGYYWPMIKPYLEGKNIIAHNTTFDITALRKTLDLFGFEYPTFNHMCTVQLSQKAYPEVESHKLNFISEALGITFNHHNAQDDSYACAMVMKHILEDFSLDSFEELHDKFEVNIGSLYPGYEPPQKKHKKKTRKKSQADA